ncbi:MAG: hypothetical protein LBV27_02950 [Oscillospiraceae bacterium]|nr:hypothetical protein [Oscillospiraceae bacterium]
MIKRLCRFILPLIYVLIWPLAVHAGTYIDNMGDNTADDIRTCYNLMSVDMDSNAAWSSQLPDKTLLSFSDTAQPVGKVVYTVGSASTITVAIYTDAGSFASLIAKDNIYALGFNDNVPDFSRRPSGSIQASYSPSRQAAYINRGSGLQSLVFNDYYEFRDSGERDPGDLIDYGVNVYASADGNHFTRIPLSGGKTQFIPKAAYCYEEFSGNVPAGATKIVVEINDFSQYYDAYSQKYWNKSRIRMTGLALVSFSGTDMTLGPPKPDIPLESSLPTEPPVTAPTDTPSSSSKASRTSSSASSKRSDAEEESVAKSGSSKFEGIITSSKSSSSKTQASAGTQKSVKSQTSNSSESKWEESDSKAAEQDSEDDTSQETRDVTIYKTQAEESPDFAFSWIVGIYIGVIFLFILIIILRSKNHKK